MMLQQIMVRAHEIARQCEGHYSARLVLGLRQAWKEQRLVAAGGSRWQKNGMDRIYFNDLHQWYGLELTYYKTGHISSATLNGEHISNAQGSKIGARFAFAKVFYDTADCCFHGKDIQAEDFRVVVSNIRSAAHLPAPETSAIAA